MANEQNPQSESLDTILSESGDVNTSTGDANVTAPATLPTEVDLGNGTKVSMDDLREAYQFKTQYKDVSIDDVKNTVEFRQWMDANPDKAQKIYEIATAKEVVQQAANKVAAQNPQQALPPEYASKIDYVEKYIANIELDKQLGEAKAWATGKGIEWNKDMETKVLRHISKTGDDAMVATKILAVDILPQLAATKAVNSIKQNQGAFTEGRGSQPKSPMQKDVSQMSDTERRDAIGKELDGLI